MAFNWHSLSDIPPRSYVCGYCNHLVGPSRGFHSTAAPVRYIYACSCGSQPTYFDTSDKQYPGVAYGARVEHLPAEIGQLYNEARNCVSVASYTAAVLACRKILMHIAVQKGAPVGKKFIEYIDHLSAAGYVPPDGKHWVDHIRRRGNEANHEITLMAKSDAEDLIGFVEMLLKFI